VAVATRCPVPVDIPQSTGFLPLSPRLFLWACPIQVSTPNSAERFHLTSPPPPSRTVTVSCPSYTSLHLPATLNPDYSSLAAFRLVVLLFPSHHKLNGRHIYTYTRLPAALHDLSGCPFRGSDLGGLAISFFFPFSCSYLYSVTTSVSTLDTTRVCVCAGETLDFAPRSIAFIETRS
jgi:hypothetical protein